MRPIRIFHAAPVLDQPDQPNQLQVSYHDCLRGELANVAAYCSAHPAHVECSTASPEVLGKQLSAFNLRIDHAGFGKDGTGYTVEHLYQASKVFALPNGSRLMGGRAVLDAPSPLAAKRMVQQIAKRPGARLVGFQYFNREWVPVEALSVPQSYYSWLYCNALHRQPELVRRLRRRGVTTTSDTKFNPNYGVACQAEAVALFLAASAYDPTGDLMGTMLRSVRDFDRMVRPSVPRPSAVEM